jgi:hypothetical protein
MLLNMGIRPEISAARATQIEIEAVKEHLRDLIARRDGEVERAFQTGRESHAELALAIGISPGRIAQIISARRAKRRQNQKD